MAVKTVNMADKHREIVNSKVACTQKAGIHCKHCNPKQKSINTRKRDRKLNNSRARRKLKEEIDNEWFNYIHFYELRYERLDLNEYMNEAV